MTREYRDGLILLLLGAAIFVLLGAASRRSSALAVSDFRLVYNGSRCLLQHADPYNENAYLSVLIADGGVPPSKVERPEFRELMQYPYPPTTFLLVPFALLPPRLAELVWLTLTATGFVLASVLMWKLGARYSPVVSGALVGAVLASSEMLLVHGNLAGIVVSLCLIAVWCFVEGRLVRVGVICLALALILKPHDAGLVWLYFLLAGGVYRRRALGTLMVAIVLSLPAIAWVSQVAPGWSGELRGNLAVLSARGHADDPGPATMSVHGIGMNLSLQSVISEVRDEPSFYNPASYAICGALLLVWSAVTLRSRTTPERSWIALAAVAALSLLPVYHRLYDAKLLLLAVPACALLWREGRAVGRVALALTAAGVVLTGEFEWAMFGAAVKSLHPATADFAGRMVTGLEIYPVPLVLLAMAAFYVWVYARRGVGARGVVAETAAVER